MPPILLMNKKNIEQFRTENFVLINKAFLEAKQKTLEVKDEVFCSASEGIVNSTKFESITIKNFKVTY